MPEAGAGGEPRVERERERERDQEESWVVSSEVQVFNNKMGSSSNDTSIARIRKRSFTFPSFRKVAATEEQVAQSSMKDSSTRATDQANQERARIRKAAAWQWYTRGVGEVVVPTKLRPNMPPCTAGAAAQLQPQNSAEQLPKPVLTKSLCPPSFPGHGSAAVSRFKEEADANSVIARPAGGRGAAPATPTGAPSSAAIPQTPLYDDFELSGLKTQMADFVHRLQQKPPQQKSTKPQHFDSSATSTALGAADQISSYPNLAAASGGAEATGLGWRRPVAAVHRLFRKLVMSFPKKTRNSPLTTATPESAETPVDEPLRPEDTQYHYHHYIHHHHHHYHYASPEDEMQDTLVRRRRHSESSGIHPRLASSIWEETDAEEEEEESPIRAFLVRRRRRNSDSAFASQHINWRQKAQVGGLEKAAKIGEQKQLLRRHSLDGFTNGNKQQNVDVQGGEEEFAEEKGRPWIQNANIKSSIRRHSSESFREGGMANVRWSMKPAAEETRRAGGRIGGGVVYKLGGDAPRDVIGQRRRYSESRNVIHEDIEQLIQYGMARNGSVRGSSEMMIRGTRSPARAGLGLQPPAAFLQRQPRSSPRT